jgi:hypothetical protein
MKNKSLIILFFLIGLVFVLNSNCKKDETTDSNLPTVTTSQVWMITSSYAYGEGEVTKEGTSGVTHKGVCWSVADNPTLSSVHSDEGFGPGSISSKMEPLSSGTKYYVRAYATNSHGTAFGNVVSFTTP